MVDLGTCAHCGVSLRSDRPNQRFCSVKCRQASYRSIPWVRHQANLKRRWRRSQKKRTAMRELIEAMQKAVPI